MFLFIAIMGAIMLLMAVLSLINAFQMGSSKIWQTIVVIAAAAVMLFGIYKLPYWPYNKSANTESSSSLNSASQAKQDSAFSTNLKDKQNQVFDDGTKQQQAAATELREQSILKQLKTNYKTLGTVAFSKKAKTYSVKPTSANFKKVIDYLKQNPDKGSDAKWPTTVESLKRTSASIKKILGSGYTIKLLDPDNTDKSVLIAKDGKITYNFI